MSDNNDDPKPLSFREVMGSTLAAAIGVQTFKNRQRDFTRGNVIAFAIAGVLFTIGFVIVLIAIVNTVIPQ